MLLNKHAFRKTVAAFHMCDLKELLWNVSTWSIKISVGVTVFSSVGERAFSSFLKLVTTTDIFHYFFLWFQYKHLQVFLPTATSVKISKKNWNSVKWRQKFGKIFVYHLYRIFQKIEFPNSYNSNFLLLFHITNTVFQILCVCFFRSSMWLF